MDGKGRITLPSSFRLAVEIANSRSRHMDDVQARSAEQAERIAKTVSLLRHRRDGQNCLLAFDQLYLEATIEKMLQAAGNDNQARNDARMFGTRLTELTFDSLGRCSLSAECRAHLGLEAAQSAPILFAGKLEQFEIWTPAAFSLHEAAVDARKTFRYEDYV